MSDFRTRMQKGRDGWAAKTEVPLIGIVLKDGDNNLPAILTISTRKSSRGGLATGCSVAFVSGHFMRHRMFKDFNQNYTTDEAARCTEKNIEKMHNAALADITTIEAAAREHYARYGVEDL